MFIIKSEYLRQEVVMRFSFCLCAFFFALCDKESWKNVPGYTAVRRWERENIMNLLPQPP